jgi:ribonuclease HI
LPFFGSTKKKCNTKIEGEKSISLKEVIKRAENWLRNNTYNNPILKWETKLWGEIPADFGRK